MCTPGFLASLPICQQIGSKYYVFKPVAHRHCFFKQALSVHGAHEKMIKILWTIWSFVFFSGFCGTYEKGDTWWFICFAVFSSFWFIKICNTTRHWFLWKWYPMIAEKVEELGVQPASQKVYAFSYFFAVAHPAEPPKIKRCVSLNRNSQTVSNLLEHLFWKPSLWNTSPAGLGIIYNL